MLTTVVLTKNENETIAECLNNLSFSDEIIVIDDYSSDNTLKTARNYRVRIFQRSLNNDFAAQRNFGLSKAKGDWILFVDADEIVTEQLGKEIIEAIKRKEPPAYRILRKDVFLGRNLKYGEVKNIHLVRLARKGSGYWERPVHETWNVFGKTGSLEKPLFHIAHKNVTEILSKINYYSTINASYLHNTKSSVNGFDVFIYPSIKFILNYILKRGYKDGMEGLMFAVFMSFHSFLTRAKLFLLKKKHV